MDEFTFPCTKGGSVSSEGSAISENPYIPCSCQHNFKEEGMPKAGPSMKDTLLYIRTSSPINAQVIPYPGAKLAIKEQVNHVLIYILIANETEIIILA